jgi:anti-sigma regulatory factor (Ser/Thr protein kinase)
MDGREEIRLRQELAQRERELRAVRAIAASLHARADLDDLIRRTLLEAIATVEAGAGSILLHEPETDCLVFRYVVGPSVEVTEYLMGRAIGTDQGISGLVFRTGQAVLTPDAEAEARHCREIDLATHHRTRDIVTAPLTTHEGRSIGVMQLLNRREGTFDEQDLRVLEIVSAQAAAAIETAALHARVLESEVQKKRFTSQVLRCVTGDRLRVVEADEIPAPGGPAWERALEGEDWYPEVRSGVMAAAEQAGLNEEAAGDFILAVGEATTNATKHARGGRCVLYAAEDHLAVRVADEGAGIRPDDLPAAVLQAGFSTKVSLGMGFTVMLQTTDRIWLATGPGGTVVQLEKWLRPERQARDPLAELLRRF